MPKDDDETRARIAQLKQWNRELLTSLPELGEAMLFLVSGVVVSNESQEYAQRAMSFQVDIDDRMIRCIYGLSHESVHMRQLISTPFVMDTAMQLGNLCAITNRRRRMGSPQEEWLPVIIQDFRELRRRLEVGEPGFSTAQVIEAQAIIEGFRGAFSKHTEQGLVHMVRIAHGLESDYAETIGRLLGGWGFNFTLGVVPKLSWLALQTETPGSTFTNMLISLAEGDGEQLAQVSASSFCSLFGLDPRDLGRSVGSRMPALDNHSLKVLFGDYFSVLDREDDPEKFLQLVMHPGLYARSDLMPPLTVFSDDRYFMNGPFREKGWSAAEPLIEIATITTQTLNWINQKACQCITPSGMAGTA